MSFKNCFSNIEKSDIVQALDKDIKDILSDINPFQTSFWNSIFPVVVDMFGNVAGGLIAEMYQQMMDEAADKIVPFVEQNLGAVAMILTSSTEWQIYAFSQFSNELKKLAEDRLIVLREIRSILATLRSVMSQIIEDRKHPEIYIKVNNAMRHLTIMLSNLYRVEDGLRNFSYMHVASLNQAQKRLDAAIKELGNNDEELQNLFDPVVGGEERNTRIRQFLEDTAKNEIRKKELIATTIYYSFLDLCKKIPIPMSNAKGIIGGYAGTVPQTPLDEHRDIFGTIAQIKGIKNLTESMSILKNIMVSFKTNWTEIERLAKIHLTGLNFLIPRIIRIRDDMHDTLIRAENQSNPTILHMKRLPWVAELTTLQAMGILEGLTVTGESQNLVLDLRAMDEIILYLTENEIDGPTELIKRIIDLAGPLSSAMLNPETALSARIQIGDTLFLLDRYIAAENKLITVLDKLNLDDNPGYSAVKDGWKILVGGASGILSGLNLNTKKPLENFGARITTGTGNRISPSVDTITETWRTSSSIAMAIGNCFKNNPNTKISQINPSLLNETIDDIPQTENEKLMTDGSNVYFKQKANVELEYSAVEFSKIWEQ